MKTLSLLLFLLIGTSYSPDFNSPPVEVGTLFSGSSHSGSKNPSRSLLELLREKKFVVINEILGKVPPEKLGDLELAALIYALFNINSRDSEFLSLVEVGEKRLPYLRDWLTSLKTQYLISKGKVKEALSCFEKIENGTPTQKKIQRIILAGLLRAKSRNELRGFLREIEGSEQSTYMQYLKAKAYLLLGEEKKAERIFQRLVEEHPESPVTFNGLPFLKDTLHRGILLALSGKGKSALMLLPYPTADPDILFAREIALFNAGRYRKFLWNFPFTVEKIKHKKRGKFQFRDPVSRLSYLKGHVLIALGDTAGAIKTWFDVASGRGKWAEKSAFMLSYYLMQIRDTEMGKEIISLLLNSQDPLPPCLAFRLGITSIAYQRREDAENLLRISAKANGFLRAQSLFWLFILTGNRSLRETLLQEFPYGYYSLTVSKGVHLSKNIKHRSLAEHLEKESLKRFEIFASLGINREALREVKESEDMLPWALYYSDSIGNHTLAVQISRIMMKRGAHPALNLAFPLYNLDHVMKISREVNLEPAIVLSIMREESSFDPYAISPSWALGLTQLLFRTARDVSERRPLNPQELFRAELNIKTGATYFKKSLERFGSFRLALAAYNAGPNALNRWIKKLNLENGELFTEFIPYEETRNYVRRVMRSYWIYRLLLEEREE